MSLCLMLQVAKIPTVRGTVGALVTIHASVSVFDVADLTSANSQKDRGCPGHDPGNSQRFLILHISKIPTTGMAHASRRERGNHPHLWGREGDLLNAFSKKAMLTVLKGSTPTTPQARRWKDLN